MGNWVFVKHVQIYESGSNLLSNKGIEDAIKIKFSLRDFDIYKIYSSPSLRCINTIEPLSKVKCIPIFKTPLLKERRLSSGELSSYLNAITETFNKPDFSYHGGESINQTKERLLRFFKISDLNNKNLQVASTHGVNIAIMMSIATKRSYLDCWSVIKEGDCLFFQTNIINNNLNINLIQHDKI